MRLSLVVALALSVMIGGAAAFSNGPGFALSRGCTRRLAESKPQAFSQRRRAGLSLRMGLPRGSIVTGNKWNSLALASVLETINIQEFDTDGNSQLCPNELRAALRSKRVLLTEYQFMGLLRELDRNVDGYICKEDIDETIRDIRETFDSPLSAQSLIKGSRTAAREARDKFFESIAGSTDNWRENSRRYSRTVFEASDWLKYRRSTRLIEMVLSTFNSGVLRALWFDIAIVVSICSLLLLYNHGIEDGYLKQMLATAPESAQQLAQMLPVAKLPISPFTISSPALGLLLVFRTNGAFQRFFEARALWGALINYSRTMTRQALYYMDDPRYIEETTRRTIVFARALKLHMRYDADREKVAMKEFTGLIGKAEAEKLMNATHRPCQALTDLASVVRRANLDSTARRSFDVTMENFSNQLGACERIFKTPLPLLYTRHTARFLTFWVLTLPLAMYTELKGSLMLIPIMAVIAAFKLGIEELGVQITEPFSVLPLENMCDGIEASCTEMIKRGTEKALLNDQSYVHFAGEDANQILSHAVLGLPRGRDEELVVEVVNGSEDDDWVNDNAPCTLLVDLDSENYPMMDKEAMIKMARRNVERYSTSYEDSWRLGIGGYGSSSGSQSGDDEDEDGCLI